MITQQEEELIWQCIQPAGNQQTPEQSDGYNEGEVYSTCVRLLESPECQQMKKDAEKWSKLVEEMYRIDGIKEEYPGERVDQRLDALVDIMGINL